MSARSLPTTSITPLRICVISKLAGAASGLTGFMQMALAAAFAQWIGALDNSQPWPMLWLMTLAAALSFGVFLAQHPRVVAEKFFAGGRGTVADIEDMSPRLPPGTGQNDARHQVIDIHVTEKTPSVGR